MTEKLVLPAQVADAIYVTTRDEVDAFGQREFARGVERGKFEGACTVCEAQQEGVNKLRSELNVALVAHARLQTSKRDLEGTVESLTDDAALLTATVERLSADNSRLRETVGTLSRERDIAVEGHSAALAAQATMAARFANAKLALEGELV